MLSVIHTTATLFITILLGFICGRVKLFKEGQDQILINYVFYVALPLNLFLSCYHASWTIFNGAYLLSYIISMLVVIAVAYTVSKKIFKRQGTVHVINTLCASQVDGAYFTLPLFVLIFHSNVFAVPLMLVQNTLFFTVSLIILQTLIDKEANATSGTEKISYIRLAFQRMLHVVVFNPIIALSLLGLLAGFMVIPIPAGIAQTAEFVGDSSSAVALFSLGLTCSFYLRAFSERKRIYPLVVLSVLKLLVLPLGAFLAGKMMHLQGDLLLALVLLTASPAATHTYILAKKYDTDVEIATFNVVVTTILSFFTVNLWLYWLR